MTNKPGEASMRSRFLAALIGATAFAGAAASTGVARADVVFLSNQLRPIEEAQKVREVILKDFPERVDYVVDEPGPWVARIRAEAQSGKVSAGLLGGLHGDFATVAKALDPAGDVMAKLADRGIAPAFVDLAKLGTDQALYVPWMQATYIMVANKKALPHLPEGASIDSLTYAQLAAWGQNIQKATGERKLGFPGGPKGLMYRLLQGSLYPAYTGGVVRTFKGPDAVAMWTQFREIWKSTNPRSTSFDFMQEPLLADDVWVAFDHVARVIDALRKQPDDFVAFPAPSGPKGLGYMPVLAGIAIPKGGPARDSVVKLIEHLTTPAVQVATLRETAFFPVVKVDLPTDLAPGLRLAADAVAKQAAAANALPSLLPVGLGEKNGEFNKVFTDAFQRIVLRNQDIQDALDTEGKKMAAIMQAANAGCWRPDAPSQGPCPVE
jgi:multiple sugar transport system substrate-binding protein